MYLRLEGIFFHNYRTIKTRIKPFTSLMHGTKFGISALNSELQNVIILTMVINFVAYLSSLQVIEG